MSTSLSAVRYILSFGPWSPCATVAFSPDTARPWLLVRGVVHAARHREATEVELVVPVDKFSAVGRMPGLTAFMSRQAEFHDWVCVGSTRFFLRPQRTWVPGQLDLLTCGAPKPLEVPQSIVKGAPP